MSESYRCRPSDIMNLTNDYERYCFDEACLYIKNMIADKKKPKFKDDNKNNSANSLLKKGL